MKQWLPLLYIAILAMAAPASAQCVYLDVDGDGECTAADVIGHGDATADVWIDTAKNLDGSSAECPTGGPLSIAGYDVIVTGVGVVITGWTNTVASFTQEVGVAQDGPDFWAGFQSPGAATYLPPGRNRIGTLSFSWGGSECPLVAIVPQASIGGTTHATGFWSECPAVAGDNYRVLGVDFYDACGTSAICDPPLSGEQTTWGRIKDRYRN
jgi:hypothetical protein